MIVTVCELRSMSWPNGTPESPASPGSTSHNPPGTLKPAEAYRKRPLVGIVAVLAMNPLQDVDGLPQYGGFRWARESAPRPALEVEALYQS